MKSKYNDSTVNKTEEQKKVDMRENGGCGLNTFFKIVYSFRGLW